MREFHSWIFVKLTLLVAIFFVRLSSSVPYERQDENHHIRVNFPTAWATEISPLCHNDSRSYLQSYLNREKWASKMYRATGFLSLEGLTNMDVFMSSSGLFDECLSIQAPSFKGQYCSAFFQTEILLNKNRKSIKELTKERGSDTSTFKLPRVGFCIPSSCSPLDFRSSVNQLINSKISMGGFNNQTSLVVITISDENYCYTKKKIESPIQFDEAAFIVLFTLSLLGLLVLFATFIDTWRRSFTNQPINSNWKKFVMCFSALENGRKLLSTKSPPSDLSCLHGIRFLSAMWIILYHTYFFVIFRQKSNKFGPEKSILKDWSSQAFSKGTMAVDTFFMMSGLLVSYSLLKELKRSNGRFNLFFFYLHRYIRIAPFYFLHVGFMSTLVVHIGTGPLWHFVNQYSQSCRSSWWTHLLFVKNHFMKHICIGQGWYLAADMQLFIVSPLFVYPLWKWRRAGLAWIILAIVAILGTIGTLFIYWSLSIPMPVFLERPIEWSKHSYKNYYFESWTRGPQYLAGILLGWFILRLKNQVHMNWVVVAFGWIFSIVTILFVVYGVVPFLDEELVPKMNPFFRVSYGTLSQFGWAVALCWIVFACINGYGGFVNTLLSWKGFIPLGRLTFTAYLIHQDCIQVYDIGLSRLPFYYNKLNLVANYLVVVMVSFVLAFLSSIAIEMPFINLDREFLTKFIRNKKNNLTNGDASIPVAT